MSMTEPAQVREDAAPPQFKGPVPALSIEGCAAAIDFYKKALDAEEADRRVDSQSGKIMHACLMINGGALFLNDTFPEYGQPGETPQGFVLHLHVDDVQTWWDRAIAAGCEVVMPLDVQFWGDRYGQLKDPYGITWSMGQSQ